MAELARLTAWQVRPCKRYLRDLFWLKRRGLDSRMCISQITLTINNKKNYTGLSDSYEPSTFDILIGKITLRHNTFAWIIFRQWENDKSIRRQSEWYRN